MKKTLFLLSCMLIAGATYASGSNKKLFSFGRNNKTTQSTPAVNRSQSSTGIVESVKQQYSQGKISADSVVALALYHKAASPETAAECLKLTAAKGHPQSMMELGEIYAFSPEFSKQEAEGVKLLQSAADAGYKEANEYLGFYYYTHNDFDRAKRYFDAAAPMKHGFGYAALGSMYLNGKGVKEDGAKVRENFRQSSQKGYPRGMALYASNLRTKTGGEIDYPDSFFWFYISGDLGDDYSRTMIYLPRRKETTPTSETAKQAETALQWIEAAHSGMSFKNDPLYKDGFLPSLKAREKAAEGGDDWARYYLGSMNYNGDFLNQNYARVIHYYEPIAKNRKLPHNVLAQVNERLSELYREGKGTKANAQKAEQYARAAARYGSVKAYKAVEK